MRPSAAGVASAASEGAGSREREAEEDAGRADDGRRHAERDARKRLPRPGSGRKAVDRAMTEKSCPQRRACALAGIDPPVYRRTSTRPADTEPRARMKALASERRRCGYRRLHILLKREGWPPLGRFAAQIACRATGELEETLPALPRRRVDRRQTGRTQARSGPGRQGRSRKGRTSAGARTSCRTLWRMDAGSASSARSTTAAGSAWPLSSTRRPPVSASPASWTGSPRRGASLAWWSATTAPG